MKLELHVVILVSSTGASIRFMSKFFCKFQFFLVDLFTLRIARSNLP